jgi:hypothetical protein
MALTAKELSFLVGRRISSPFAETHISIYRIQRISGRRETGYVYALVSLRGSQSSSRLITFFITVNSGTLMAIKLALLPELSQLLLLVAYESGRVAAFTTTVPDKWDEQRREEGGGWELAWWEKCHREPSQPCQTSRVSLVAVCADMDRSGSRQSCLLRWRQTESLPGR